MGSVNAWARQKILSSPVSQTSILVLTRYDRKGASSRVRILQYIPYCRQHDVDFTVVPLLSNRYIDDLYKGRPRDYVAIVQSYLRRIRLLTGLNHYDVIWIEKEIWPFFPEWFEELFYKNRARIILDYDDAIFLNYKDHRNVLVRTLLGKKIDAIVGQADIVTVGNHYLEQYAMTCGARDVRFLPSVVDITKYRPRSGRHGGEFRIGWIGTPSTRIYLKAVSGVLQKLAEQHQIKLVVIGVEDIHISGVAVETVPWSEATEVAHLQSLHIGIMPLLTTEWEKGKCGYKLIQYMACGLPVVATRFGANTDIVEHGREGFLVDDEKDWIAAIKQLMGNGDVYREMSLLAREKVEKFYSVQCLQERFLSLFLH